MGDEGGDRLAQRRGATAEALGQLGLAAAGGEELEVEEEGLAVAGEALHPLVREGAGASLERRLVRDSNLCRRQLPRPVRHVLLEDGEEEVRLAGEVGVDRAVRVAGLLGDLLYRGALVAALGEDGRGGGDQLGACARLLLGPGLAFRLARSLRLHL